MKILIIGQSIYERSNFFTECALSNNHYGIDYFDFYFSFDKKYKNRTKFKKSIIRRLRIWQGIISIITSDVIFWGPDTHSPRLFKLALLLKKIIIKEFYISGYDTLINDRKSFLSDSQQAKELFYNDNLTMARSSKVIFLNESEANYYSKIAKVDLSSIDYTIIPLGKEKMEKAKKPFYNKKKDCLTICWWGTFIPLHGLEKIIDAILILIEKGLNLELYIFGDSEQKSIPYKKIIEGLELEKHIFLNNEFTIKNGKLIEFLSNNCDIALGTFGDSEKAKTVITNKEIDSISMKIPLITGYSKGLLEYFDGINDIYMINNTSFDLADKIVEVSKKNLNEIERNIDKAYDIYLENFSIENLRNNYNKLLDEILKREIS